MSTPNEQILSERAKSSNSTMPSTCSTIANNNNNNNNNNNTNASKNNNQANTEQPKTKRQKIEKVKSNVKSSNTISTSTSSTTSSNKKCVVQRTPTPPDIDVGERDLEIGSKLKENGSKQLCSSLSSSVQSISSTPSSSNNSPSTSRATSLSHLLNVQSSVIVSGSNATPSAINTDEEALSSSSTANDNGGCSSADEVDRINAAVVEVPEIMPTPSTTKMVKAKPQKPQSLSSCSIDAAAVQDMRQFELSLTRQCLCGVSEDSLQKPFQSHYSLDANGQKRIANLSEWPTNKLLQFLSNLQLLFDIYLKQNCKGFICARIMDVCDALIRNDRNLIDEIIVLAAYSNTYVQFLAGRVLASFLVIAKQELDDNWLKKLVDNLFFFDRLDRVAVQKIHFSLEIIKRVVEWKDIDLHPLEDEIVDTRPAHAAGISDMPGGVSSLLESQHAYMHFPTRQPSLETNYFAVHYGSLNETAENASATVALSNGHEQQSALIINRGNSSLGSAQHQFDDFGNAVNISNVSSNFVLHGSEMQAMHHSSTYTQQAARQPSIPVGIISNSQTSHFENMETHFSLNNASHHHSATPMAASAVTCNIVTLTDSESFDTTSLKCITIKILENKWPALVRNMSGLIANHMSIANAENCVLNFLQLWENIISVKANLSIVETLPFYAQLDKFEHPFEFGVIVVSIRFVC